MLRNWPWNIGNQNRRIKKTHEEECVFVYVDKYEELEKSYKLILTATLKKINTNPWAFVPKTSVKDLGEIEENERGKRKVLF